MSKRRSFVSTWVGSRSGSAARCVAACLVTLLAACGGDGSETSSSSETVLHAFGATSTDGTSPNALIQGKDGNFYGTTYSGGANRLSVGYFPGATGDGTFYVITPAGVETVLYSFGASNLDGLGPSGSLIQAADGNFYGTTMLGGAADAGTVFKITPTGVETVLYSFGASSTDAINPFSGVIQGTDGNFYGTASGGAAEYGTVFMVTPSGVETVLHSFGGSPTDGQYPGGGLVQGLDGNFYGTTTYGGATTDVSNIGTGEGTVYKITPAGEETLIYSFGSLDGFGPTGTLAQDSAGNLYGTTSNDLNGTSPSVSTSEGTVFKVTPAGVETVLYTFPLNSNSGGVAPNSVTVGSDGNLYGTTENGGTGAGGVAFRITSDGAYRVLYSFGDSGAVLKADPKGYIPNGVIQASDGNLYGTTSLGGAVSSTSVGTGVVFKITLP